jgi:predicted phage replisome organizer
MFVKYYYLKLKENFFEDEKILYLEGIPNGEKYIIFWQKLLLRCLKDKRSNDGILKFTETIPYDAHLLSKITHSDIDIVRQSIKIFEKLEMIKILDDGSIYIDSINILLGGESSSTGRVRNWREKQKLLPVPEKQNCNVTETLHETQDVTIYKDNIIQDNINNNIYVNETLKPLTRIDYDFVVKSFHNKLPMLNSIKIITEDRKKKIKNLSEHMKCTDDSYTPWITYFQKVSKSKFLIGKSDKQFKATFDWLLKYSNYVKVMESNYEK